MIIIFYVNHHYHQLKLLIYIYSLYDTIGFDDGRVYTEKTDYTKIPKKKFRHPQLEYTIAEIMHSPYLANPLNNYPIENNKLSLKIKELKKAGIKYHDLSEEEKPFNYKELMKRFNDEVCYYLPGHGVDKKTEEVSE